MELLGFCRACGDKDKKPKSNISLLSDNTKQTFIFLMAFLDFSEDDGLPQKICVDCIVFLEQHQQFQLMCARQDKRFRHPELNDVDGDTESATTDLEDEQEDFVDEGITITCVDCNKTYINLSDYNAHSDSCTPHNPVYSEVFMISEEKTENPSQKVQGPRSNAKVILQLKKKPIVKKNQLQPKEPEQPTAKRSIISLKGVQDLLISKLLRNKGQIASRDASNLYLLDEASKRKKSLKNSSQTLKKRKAVHVCKEDQEEEFEVIHGDGADSPIIAVATSRTKKKKKKKTTKDDPINLCELCFKTFSKPEQLEDHMAGHLVGVFKCRKCNQYFNTNGDRAEHKCEDIYDEFVENNESIDISNQTDSSENVIYPQSLSTEDQDGLVMEIFEEVKQEIIYLSDDDD